MFGLLHIFTIISYSFYSTAYISLKRNNIKKGKEQNTWCNRNQSFLQCSCVENGERRDYPQCNMILPTMQYCTLDGIVYVCVFWGGTLKTEFRGGTLKTILGGYSEDRILGGYSEDRISGGILNFRIGVFCRIWTKFSTTPAGSCITDSLSHTTYVETNQSTRKFIS